jgi:molybdopterin-containing oxidoreductase family membrane subunit
MQAPTLSLAGRTIPLGPRAAAGAVRAEYASMGRGLRIWIGALLVLLAIAAPAALIALPPGWEVLGTSPTFEWGLLIVGYVFFAITTSGLCLASSLGTVFGIERFKPLEKRHAILAILSLTAAFGIIALDLHYPVRMVFGAVLIPSPSSPMWWMGVFYGGYLVFLLVEVWSMFFGHPTIHQFACVASSCMAIVAPATLGAVFGVLGARPFWHGPFTPVLMVASAFLAGTAVLAIVFWAVQRFRLAGATRARELAIPGIRILLAIGLVMVGLLVARQLVAGLMSPDARLQIATKALLVGPLAVPYWTFRLVLGLIVPLALVLLPMVRRPRWIALAAGLALVGVFVDRLTFVMAGQVAPTSAAGVVTAPYSTYLPSPVEIAIVVGAGAFVALGYTLSERYLDLNESDAHVTFPGPALAAYLRRRFRRSEPTEVPG